MKKTLRELEREAYMRGDKQMSDVLSEYIDSILVMDGLISNVRADVEESHNTRHLFTLVEDAEEMIAKVYL